MSDLTKLQLNPRVQQSFEGALGVVRKIGPIHSMNTEYMEVREV